MDTILEKRKLGFGLRLNTTMKGTLKNPKPLFHFKTLKG
uniref:Uncharacterized protein n=1 Tax=Anguilla anguilla TaxID=7936 RepID=A0A0E9UP54_ANGAN